MTDNEEVKNNRLAMLSDLKGLFGHVADLGVLQS